MIPHSSPGDLLGQDGPRVAAAAVFGILFSSLCQLVLDPDPLPLLSPASPAARGEATAPPGPLGDGPEPRPALILALLPGFRRVLEDPGAAVLPRVLLPAAGLCGAAPPPGLRHGHPAGLGTLRGAAGTPPAVSPGAQGGCATGGGTAALSPPRVALRCPGSLASSQHVPAMSPGWDGGSDSGWWQ